jgi:hypothetical protein
MPQRTSLLRSFGARASLTAGVHATQRACSVN